MFKRTSENMVRRDSHKEENSRANTSGIDPSTFVQSEFRTRRQAVVADLLDCEAELAKLNANIGEATRRFTSRYAKAVDNEFGRDQIVKWKSQKAILIARIRGIQKILSAINVEKAHFKKTEGTSFERAFMNAAKSMLAEPIFKRIVVAAAHSSVEEGTPDA